MAVAQGEDTRVMCPACDGTCWSRSARGRCINCKGTGLVERGVVGDESPGGIPALGPMPTVHRGPKPPHIGRAVLVAQRDVRTLGGARRSAIMMTTEGAVRYADAEEVISLGGDALLPLGVAAGVTHVEPCIEPVDGSVRRLSVTLALEHPESGEVWEEVRHVAVQWDQDHTLAQAENAAATTALATWLVHTLNIPRGYRSADVLVGQSTAPSTEPEAPKKEDENAALVKRLLAEIRGTRTVAELEPVAKNVRRHFGRQIRREQDQKLLHATIVEHELKVKASDAHRAAEGPQGRAA